MTACCRQCAINDRPCAPDWWYPSMLAVIVALLLIVGVVR